MNIDFFNNEEGARIREELLNTFRKMLRPVRIMMGLERGELAVLSGLDEEFIESVEEGKEELTETQYIALAAVLGYLKPFQNEAVYEAMKRILLPENFDMDNGTGEDFEFLQGWFATFQEAHTERIMLDNREDNESREVMRRGNYKIPDDELEDDLEEIDEAEHFSDDELKSLTEENCEIIADDSAIADESFPALMTRLDPFLKISGSVLNVPEAAINNLQRELDSNSDERESPISMEEAFNLSEAISYIHRKHKEGLVEILPSMSNEVEIELSDRFEDYKEKNFMLITQEPSYAEILTANYDNVKASRIDDNGDLVKWEN